MQLLKQSYWDLMGQVSMYLVPLCGGTEPEFLKDKYCPTCYCQNTVVGQLVLAQNLQVKNENLYTPVQNLLLIVHYEQENLAQVGPDVLQITLDYPEKFACVCQIGLSWPH